MKNTLETAKLAIKKALDTAKHTVPKTMDMAIRYMTQTKLTTRKLLILATAASFLLLVIICCIAGGGSDTPLAVPVETGWKTEEGHTYYLLEDGSRAVGWQTIDDHDYYFRSSGSMVTRFSTCASSPLLTKTGAAPCRMGVNSLCVPSRTCTVPKAWGTSQEIKA